MNLLSLRLFFLLPAFLLLTSHSFSQTLYPGNSFEARFVIGSHALGAPDGALQDRLYGLDVSYQTDISHITDYWAKLFKAQSAGVGLLYRDLQYLKGFRDTSANAFGQAFGMVGQADFRVFKSGEFTVNFKPAIGLSYLNKTFFTDKRNRFIGSHLNQVIKADLSAQLGLNARLDLIAGAGFLHFSNGGYNIPNSGINMLSLSAGLRFKKAPLQKNEYHTGYLPIAKSSFELNVGIGRRGIFEQHGGLLKSGVFAGYNWYLNKAFSFKTGFDAVYYYTVFDGDIKTFQYYGTSNDQWRTGLSAGPEVSIWRFGLNAQLGKYLHFNRYYEDIKWFWTTGLVYQLTPNVGLQAKTYFHRSQADFINYGLVFKL